MKKTIILLLITFSSNCFAQNKTDTLKNDDVIKLAKNKLPESVITQKINSANCKFEISVDGLIKLKENNVGDNLINLIVKRQTEINSAIAILSTESKVEYRVTSVDTEAKFVINYRDDKEQFLGSSGESGWIYSFKTNRKPFTSLLTVHLYPTKIFKTTTTVTILVNDKIVATKTGVTRGGEGLQVQFVIRVC